MEQSLLVLLCMIGDGDTAGVHQSDLELRWPERREWFALPSAGLRGAWGTGVLGLGFRTSFWEKDGEEKSLHL